MKHRRIRSVEAEGFYHGTQGVSPEATQAELDAQFQRAKEDVQHDTTERLKRLEAAIETLARDQHEAKKHWDALEAETQGRAPEALLPLVALFLAAVAVGGEVVLLAPVMDAFGIADRLWQFFTALVLVLVCSGLIELTARQLRIEQAQNRKEHQASRLHLATALFLTVLAFALIFFLGWWRAEEMIFASKLIGGEWGGFLERHPDLTRVCVILITIALPVFAAATFDWGFRRLRYWWHWRKTRWALDRFSRRLDRARKKLEAEKEKRDHRLAALGQQQKEWQQAYLENHELGRVVGARRQPLWQVLVKILAVALLIVAVCLLLDPWVAQHIETGRWLLYSFLVFGLGGLYAYRELKAWDRPSPWQLYKQRVTIWRDEPSPAPARKEVARTVVSDSQAPLAERKAAS